MLQADLGGVEADTANVVALVETASPFATVPCRRPAASRASARAPRPAPPSSPAAVRGRRPGCLFGTIRQPTAEECRLVGRDTFYSEPFDPQHYGDYRVLGDYVIERGTYAERPELLELLHRLCDELAIGDDVHILPGVGVYIEE